MIDDLKEFWLFIYIRLHLVVLGTCLFVSGCVFTVPRLEYTPTANVSSFQIPTDESVSIFVGPITDARDVPPQSLDYVLTTGIMGDQYSLPVPLAEEVRKFIIAELKRMGITVVSQRSDATGYFEATITGYRFVVEFAGAATATFTMTAILNASGEPRPLWASTLKGTGTVGGMFGTKRISVMTSQALSQAIGSLGENQSFVDIINQLSAGKEITFNVLDQVVVNEVMGKCTEGDCNNGEGTRTWPDGMMYIGMFKNGWADGQGTLTLPYGSKYVGEWKDAHKHGQGTATWSNGKEYFGEWKDGKQHGQGTHTWPDGSMYVGEWSNGKQHGKGTFAWSNGDKYVGEWKNGMCHGQGTLTLPDGSKYVGEWKDGKPHRE